MVVDSDKFILLPKVDLNITSASKTYNTVDQLHQLTATCVNPDGSDHSIAGMDFYYKFDDETSYTLISSKKYDEKDAPVEHTTIWDSGTNKGKVTIKAVADLSWSSLTREDSVLVEIFEGFECRITEPQSYDVEAVNFEQNMPIKGFLYSDGSLDLSTLDPNYSILDEVLIKRKDFLHLWKKLIYLFLLLKIY